jgi:hypothetical protein
MAKLVTHNSQICRRAFGIAANAISHPNARAAFLLAGLGFHYHHANMPIGPGKVGPTEV